MGIGVLFIESVNIDLRPAQHFTSQEKYVPVNGVVRTVGRLFPFLYQTFDWFNQVVDADIVDDLLHKTTQNCYTRNLSGLNWLTHDLVTLLLLL